MIGDERGFLGETYFNGFGGFDLWFILCYRCGRFVGWDHVDLFVYDEAQIKTALDQKEKVFIDFSAKWCLTCLANEKLVLDTQDFIDYAQQNNIKLFRADWTTKNPQITKALEAFGRNSVPLYVFYNQGEPAVLPQIFTFNQLISYLEQK